jgi:hypothetical protein
LYIRILAFYDSSFFGARLEKDTSWFHIFTREPAAPTSHTQDPELGHAGCGVRTTVHTHAVLYHTWKKVSNYYYF